MFLLFNVLYEIPFIPKKSNQSPRHLAGIKFVFGKQVLSLPDLRERACVDQTHFSQTSNQFNTSSQTFRTNYQTQLLNISFNQTTQHYIPYHTKPNPPPFVLSLLHLLLFFSFCKSYIDSFNLGFRSSSLVDRHCILMAAAASSFASTSLPELKIKPKIGSGQFLRFNSSSFPCLIRVFNDKINRNNASIKGLPFLNPRCEEAVWVRNSQIESKPKASSFSALELLKTSAADSESILSFRYWIYFFHWKWIFWIICSIG